MKVDRMSDFSKPFVSHGGARSRFSFLGVSGVNTDLMMQLVFWNVFGILSMKICGSCLLNKNIYANQFLAANPNLKPRSRARSWMDTNPTEMKSLIGLLILQGIV